MGNEKAQDLEKQADLVYQISSLVASEAPEGWESIRFVAHKTSTVSAYETSIQRDGVEEVARSSFSAMDLCGDLREEMYQPGLGAWFSFTLEIAADGRVTTLFDYDNEPVISSADAENFVFEQKHFPRDEEHQPEWYRARLAEGERLIAEREAQE